MLFRSLARVSGRPAPTLPVIVPSGISRTAPQIHLRQASRPLGGERWLLSAKVDRRRGSRAESARALTTPQLYLRQASHLHGASAGRRRQRQSGDGVCASTPHENSRRSCRPREGASNRNQPAGRPMESIPQRTKIADPTADQAKAVTDSKFH